MPLYVIRRLLSAFAVTCVVSQWLLIPTASAAPPVLNISVSPVSPSVLSGDDMTWLISWACSSVDTDCLNASITIPTPASQPDGVLPTPVAISDDAGHNTSTRTLNAAGATWLFRSPLPAGTSGQMTVTWKSQNVVTPTGSIYQPVATFAAQGVSSASSNPADATVTVNASAGVGIDITRLPSDAAQEPFPGGNVSYRVLITNTYNYPNTTPGTAAIQDLIGSIDLPPSATFLAADYSLNSGGGPGGSGVCTHSGPSPGGTVTCPTLIGSFHPKQLQVVVTVSYPSTQTAHGTPAAIDGDEVTIVAHARASAWLRPLQPVAADDTTFHGFRPIGTGGAGINFSKSAAGAVSVQPGQVAFRWITTVSNTGTGPANVHFADRFPCVLTTPTGGGANCQPQATPITRVVTREIITSDTNLTLTFSDGSTASVTFAFPTPVTGHEFNAPPGLSITDVIVDTQLDPGESVSLHWYGSIPNSVPLVIPPGTAYRRSVPPVGNTNSWIENCMSDLQYQQPTGPVVNIAMNPNIHCWAVEVLAPKPVCSCSKSASNNVQGIGGEVTFRLTTKNSGTSAEFEPVLTDLLPARMTYVPNSTSITMTSPLATPRPDFSQVIVETIDNFAGTGRQLVRWHWPQPGNELGLVSGGQTGRMDLTFRAAVGPGHPQGLFTNTAMTFNSAINGALTCGTYLVDSFDQDGDGNTGERGCIASATYTVVASAAMSARKAVQGAFDATYQYPLNTGTTFPNGTGRFRIDLVNDGNVNLRNPVAYDVLPFVGDQAIGPGNGPRDSAWEADYLGNLSLPLGMAIEYSASTNPCRGEVIGLGLAQGSGPAGCVNDWTSVAPADLSIVQALRFVYSGDLAPGGVLQVEFDVRAPSDATGVAWNSVSMASVRSDTMTWLQPTESPKVGLEVPIDLSVTKKVVSTDPPRRGGTITYEIALANEGPGHATGVTLDDAVPAGLTLFSASPSVGSYDGSTNRWNIGDVAVGDTPTLRLTFEIGPGASSPLLNVAEVATADQRDVDSTPGNGLDEDDRASASTLLFAVVGDTVWFDQDGDGIQDDNEPPVAGVGVELLDASGTVIDMAQTDAQGKYLFDAAVGTYSVRFIPPAGFALTNPHTGFDAESDSDPDPNSATTDPFDLLDEDLSLDAGLVGTGSIGDTVWHDLDGDGTLDAGEPPLSGWPVELRWYGSDGVAGTTDDAVFAATTDVAGQYLFPHLPPGRYSVTVSAQPTWLPSGDPDGGRDAISELVLDPGEQDLAQDFGFVQLASLGDTVFLDRDANGVQDATDGFVEGVTVRLTGVDALGRTVERDYTTGQDGRYLFTDLWPGSYHIVLDGIPADFAVTPQRVGDPLLDSDIDAAGVSGDVIVLSGDARRDVDGGLFPTTNLAMEKAVLGNDIARREVTYRLTVSNVGSYATVGLVTVADVLPEVLTATSAFGAGWTCSIDRTVTCSSSETLEPGGQSTIDVVTSVQVGYSGVINNHAVLTSVVPSTNSTPTDDGATAVLHLDATNSPAAPEMPTPDPGSTATDELLAFTGVSQRWIRFAVVLLGGGAALHLGTVHHRQRRVAKRGPNHE